DDLLGEVPFRDEERYDVDAVRLDQIEDVPHGRFFLPEALPNLVEDAGPTDHLGVPEDRGARVCTEMGSVSHNDQSLQIIHLGTNVRTGRVIGSALEVPDE